MGRRTFVLVAVMAALLTLSRAGAAQTADAKARAQELFQKGRQAVVAQDCNRAVPLFQESYALVPMRGTLFNLAQCEEQTGRLAEALAHFTQLDAELPPNDARRRVVKKSAAELEKRVPSLEIELTAGAAPPAKVMLDGNEMPLEKIVGGALRLNPGKHAVHVRWGGGEERLYPLTLSEGVRERLHLDPPPSKPQPRLPPPQTDGAPRSSSIPWRTIGFVVGGAGVAALGVSAVTGALTLDRKGDVESLCPDPSHCSDEGLSVADDGKSLATVSTVTLVAGLGLVGLGVTLVVTSGEGAAPPPVALEVNPTGGGVIWRGSF